MNIVVEIVWGAQSRGTDDTLLVMPSLFDWEKTAAGDAADVGASN